MNPGRNESSSPRRIGPIHLDTWNQTMRPPPVESLLPGLYFALKNLLNLILDGGDMVD